MLGSDLLQPLHQDLGNPIPDTVKGAITLLAGLFLVVGLLNGALLIPLLMVVLLLVVFTWRQKLVIDMAKGRYYKKQGPFGLRLGSTKAFGTPEFISIREKVQRDGGQFVLMTSASSRKKTLALLAFEENDDMLLIMQGEDASRILAQAQTIAAHYNIPWEDERA